MKNIVHDGTATLQSWTNHLQMELKVVDKVKLGGVVLATCSSGLLHLKKINSQNSLFLQVQILLMVTESFLELAN